MADLRTELSLLMEAHGRLTPQLLVDAARPDDSPLHNRFEWDDEVAGEKYRLDQAREIIRSVKVVYRDATTEERARSYRMYSSIRTEEGRAYVPTQQALEDPFTRRLLIQQMRREMASLNEKFQHLAEWAELLDEYRKTG
jgi:hypothetical protein